jgi:hypothetical protein
MKSICRILVGVALLYPAYWTRVAAHKLSDKTLGIEETVIRQSPPIADIRLHPAQPHDADFFGDDPREFAKKPENQKKLEEAVDMDQRAALMALVSMLLILWGLYPVLRAVAKWLLIPEWLRQRMEQQAEAAQSTECKESGNGKPEIETRRGSGNEQGHCGHLPEPAAAGGIPGCDGRDLRGGEGGTGSV